MRRLKSTTLGILSLALAISPTAVIAQATMTFAPTSCAGTGFNSVASPYTESGFTLSTAGANGFATWCTGSPNYGGVPSMFINTSGFTASLTKNGGGAFSITSIDLAHLFGVNGPYGPESFTFIGNQFGGGTVSQTFTIGQQEAGSSPSFADFMFGSEWTNLMSVTFAAQGQHGYQFTDVVLASSVPEPASMALLATGLVGVFGAARRRLTSV